MRLIDADKLRHELIMGHDLIGAKYTDMADTVKAIPIDWIEKWSRQFYDKNGRYNGEGYDSVWDLLEDWEKENETTDENASNKR